MRYHQLWVPIVEYVLLLKRKQHFLVHCWKQGRLSNIFKTCITYFSSYFSQSLVSFIFFGVFFFVFVCFNFRWFLFFFKSYIYFLLFENSKIWIMLCSSKRQISNWITNVIISIDTRVTSREYGGVISSVLPANLIWKITNKIYNKYIYIKSKGIYQPENLMSNGSLKHDDAVQTK